MNHRIMSLLTVCSTLWFNHIWADIIDDLYALTATKETLRKIIFDAQSEAKVANEAKTKAEDEAKDANEARIKALAEAKAANEARDNALAEAKTANEAKVKALAEAKTANEAKAAAEAQANNKKKSKSKNQSKAQGIATTSADSASLSSPGCSFVGAHALADWLNSISIGSSWDISSRYMMRNSECFVIFDPSENLNVWLEPYGFFGHYRSSKDVKLSLSSIGSGLGARYALFDGIHLGGGAGYFHSDFNSKGDHGSINGFYFGPSFEYLFSEGSLGLMVMGIRNFYAGERKIILPANSKDNQCKGKEYNEHSWDLDLRLEGEYDIQVPSDVIKGLTIHPTLRIDYLNVFEKGAHYKLDPKKSKIELKKNKSDLQKNLDIKDRHTSFLYSKLSVRFEKMLYCTKTGFFAADFDAGWVNMTPLSSAAFKWEADGSANGKHHNITPQSKNQCALGIDLIGVHQIGLLMGLGYQVTLGANSPIQVGRFRFEWNW